MQAVTPQSANQRLLAIRSMRSIGCACLEQLRSAGELAACKRLCSALCASLKKVIWLLMCSAALEW